MVTLKLHYDGWLVLPAGLRRALELESGDRLKAELVDGAIVLRPAKGKRPATRPEKVAEPPVAVSVPTSLPEPPAVAKRPRGRPRKGRWPKCKPSCCWPRQRLPCPPQSASRVGRARLPPRSSQLLPSRNQDRRLPRAVCGSCGRRPSCRSQLLSLFPCHPAELSPLTWAVAMSAKSGDHFGMSRYVSWGRDAGTIDRSEVRTQQGRSTTRSGC